MGSILHKRHNYLHRKNKISCHQKKKKCYKQVNILIIFIHSLIFSRCSNSMWVIKKYIIWIFCKYLSFQYLLLLFFFLIQPQKDTYCFVSQRHLLHWVTKTLIVPQFAFWPNTSVFGMAYFCDRICLPVWFLSSSLIPFLIRPDCGLLPGGATERMNRSRSANFDAGSKN